MLRQCQLLVSIPKRFVLLTIFHTVMLLLSGEKMAMQVAEEKADAAAKKTLEEFKAEEIAIKQATERQELAE